MSAYKIGDRVVCPDPGGRWFVGTIDHVHNCGDLTVSDGDGFFRASASEVRPVMPRDRADLERWGRWWWVDGDVVAVSDYSDSLCYHAVGLLTDFDVNDREKWAGPVAPPPEVRP